MADTIAPYANDFDAATQVQNLVTAPPMYSPEQVQAAKQAQLEQEMQKIKGVGTYGQDPLLLQNQALDTIQGQQDSKNADAMAAQKAQQDKMAQIQALNEKRIAQGMPPLPATPGATVTPSNLSTQEFNTKDPLAGQQQAAAPGATFDPVKEYQHGYDLQKAGVQGIATAQQHVIAAQAETAKNLQKDFEKQQAESLLREQEVKSAGDDAVKTFKDVQQQIKDFKFHDYWEDKSTGQKVVAGIAIALGGIGGAMTGKGDNKALDVINQAMDKDLQLQKLNYTKLKDQGEGARNLYGMYMEKYHNEAMASQATLAALSAAAQNKLIQTVAPYQSAEVQARAQTVLGPLAQQHAQALQSLEQHAMIVKIANGQTNIDMRNLSPEMQQVLEASGQSQYKNFSKRYVQGYGPVGNEDTAKELNKYVQEAKPLINSLDNIISATKKLGALDEISRKELRSQLVQITPALVKASGASRVSQGEIELMGKALGDPTARFQLPGAAVAKLNAIRKQAQATLNEKMKAAGLMAGVQPVQNANPFPKK